MAKLIYTEERLEYLREISEGKYNDEITKLFNKRFNLNITESGISTIRQRKGFLSNVSTGRSRFTEKQLNYLKEIGDSKPNKEITKLFNEKFNLDIPHHKITNLKWRNNIPSQRVYAGIYEKGMIPWNKGLKGYMGANKTSFKKGSFSPKRVPIGTERVIQNGYAQIKVKDFAYLENWKGKHIIVWEEENGPVPKGHAIIFGDKDKTNFNINNLICVSRKELLGLNKMDLIQDDAELTKTAINIVNVAYKISQRRL